MSVDIRPTRQEIVAICCATLQLAYTVRDAHGQAVDLSTSTSKMLLKADISDPDDSAVAEFTLSPAAPANGEFTATLSAVQTAEIAPGVYYADHHVRILDGDAAGDYVVASFVIRFELPVTRSVA